MTDLRQPPYKPAPGRVWTGGKARGTTQIQPRPAQYTQCAGRNRVVTRHHSPSIRRGAATPGFSRSFGSSRKSLPLPSEKGSKNLLGAGLYYEWCRSPIWMEQVCCMGGAGMYDGWRKLDFRWQTGANRMRICRKRGAGMYNIFKPLPLAWQTCTTYTTNLHHPHNKPAPSTQQTSAIHTTNLHRWRSSWRRSRKKRKRNAEKSKKVAFNLKRNRPQTCARHRKCNLSVSFLTKRISIPSFAKRETIPG